MPQLLFEPAVNKLGEDDYIIVTKNDSDTGRVAIRANSIAKDIILAMYPERCSQEKNAEAIAEKYGITYEEALEQVNAVIASLRGGGS